MSTLKKGELASLITGGGANGVTSKSWTTLRKLLEFPNQIICVSGGRHFGKTFAMQQAEEIERLLKTSGQKKEKTKVKEQKNEYEVTTETAGFVFHVYFNTEYKTTVGKLARVPKEFYHYVNSIEVTSRVEKTVCSAEDEYKAHIGMNIVKHKLISWIKGLAFQRMKRIEDGIYAAASVALVATRNTPRQDTQVKSSWSTCGCSGCRALRGATHEELMEAVDEFKIAGRDAMNRIVTTSKPGHLMAAAVRKVTGK